MRFRRRPGEADEAVAADGIRATYARLLDGEHLWLALPVTTGTAVLRDLASGDVLTPVNQLADPEPGCLTLRWLLVDGSLPGDTAAEYAVEWQHQPGGATAVLAPAARRSPTKAPPSPDGRWQFTTRAGGAGQLLLRRERAPRRASLLTIDAETTGLRVECRELSPEDAFALVDEEGRQRTDLPTSHSGGRISAVIRPEHLPSAAAQLVVTGPEDDTPVGRRNNELRNPGGVLLPTWTGDGAERGLRARYGADATLHVDLVDEPGEPA